MQHTCAHVNSRYDPHGIRDARARSSGLPDDGDDDGRDRQSADRTPDARLGSRLAAPDEARIVMITARINLMAIMV